MSPRIIQFPLIVATASMAARPANGRTKEKHGPAW
jgi:hypothetical protein